MSKNKLFISAMILVFIAITMSSLADDTEIYGSNTVAVRPNVLIIFDNSSSMEKFNTIAETYDYTKTYSESVIEGYTVYSPKEAIYYRRSERNDNWVLWTKTIQETCLNDLTTKGYLLGIPVTNQGVCSDSNNVKKYDFRTANYMNYTNSSAVQVDKRYIVAKNAISDIVKNNPDKNFGLMVFRDEKSGYNSYTAQGGKLVLPCKDTGEEPNTTLSNTLLSLDDDDFYAPNGDGRGTPLAEALSEAGHYFAGKKGWFSEDQYTTPITESCQANYIIVVTDGDPSLDDDARLYNKNDGISYMNGLDIGNADGDTNNEELYANGTLVPAPPNTQSGYSHFLDDVAYFLNTQDIYTKTGESDAEGNQTIRTFTIGFGVPVVGLAASLLQSTADDGDGDYYHASNASDLAIALKAINENINQTSSVFLAPSIPVNRTAKTEQSDWLYLALFKPQNPGEWLGNIKKFALGKNGEIYGRNPAVSDPEDPNYIDRSKEVVDEYGQIKDNACSFWTINCDDGNEVTAGGSGGVLQLENEAADTRTLYCYTGTESSLTHASNIFKDSNTALISKIQEIAPTATPSTLISSTRKFTDAWKLGAIIHSEPAVVHYSNTQSVIFVGANDGMLHCFDDNTGQELWGFIPPGQISNLVNISDGLHNYYVDGSPTVTFGPLMTGTQHFQPQYMIFGERRGGDRYYVLDITDYNAPAWKYQIDPTILGSAETLGESWCKPIVCTMATKKNVLADNTSVPAGLTDVFLIGGGYDSSNQDNDPPTKTIDIVGKAIYAVNTATGTLTSSAADGSLPLFKITDLTPITGLSSVNGSYIKNCIVDISTSSTIETSDGKDITTRVYAGDLGGNIYAFSDDMYIDTVNNVKTLLYRVPDGSFPLKVCLFSLPGKKIFYAPSVSRIKNTFSEYVVFGTGDREKPKKIINMDGSTAQNGIYVLKNTWLNNTPYTESDLTNLTENLISEGTSNQKKEVADALLASQGWYINFYDAGEKMISQPIITNGYIYFTTYVPPETGGSLIDPCEVGSTGITYLWAIDLETGAPVHDTNNDGLKEKEERRKRVAVMAQPTLSGDLISTPAADRIPGRINSNYFFWRQR